MLPTTGPPRRFRSSTAGAGGGPPVLPSSTPLAMTTIFASAKYGLLVVLAMGLAALGLCVVLDCASA